MFVDGHASVLRAVIQGLCCVCVAFVLRMCVLSLFYLAMS